MVMQLKSTQNKALVAFTAFVGLGILSFGIAQEARGALKDRVNYEIQSNLIAQNQDTSNELSAFANDGIPEGLTEQEWLAATGAISVSEMDSENYTVTVEASNLVPDGLYTLWWVNKKLVGMDMGPAGGSPNNEFRADSDGNATTAISVPANNNYQTLVVAYHADGRTHGEMPGEMGQVTFGHLKGNFARPN